MGGKEDQQQVAATASLYSTITPHFTQDLLTPGLKIGYQDDGGVWEFLERSLVQRLPLRSIEWKNRVGVVKRIDKLQLNFVNASKTRELAVQNMPIVCLYVVKCEEMDTYKSQVRSQLMGWVDQMNLLRVEWMILYVPLGTRAKANPSPISAMSSGVASAMAMATHRNSSSHSIYKKIYEKIKSDFSSKRNAASTSSDRTCKIEILDNSTAIAAPGQQQQHDAQWSELLLKLRNCIMAAFETKCFQYEEDLRVLDAKRATTGWDFGAFFLAKDRLALMYQQAYLLDDAIRHMDELEAIFSSMTPNEAILSLDKLAKPLPSCLFTLSPLALDLDALPTQITCSQAPGLVIRLYLFCRQIQMLYLAGDFLQLIDRALAFCSSFFESLTKQCQLHWIEPYQWVVGACLEIAYACELSWGGHDYQVSSASVSEMATKAVTPEQMSRQLARLLYLARRFLKSAQKQEKTSTTIDRDADGTAAAVFPSTKGHQESWYDWLRRALMDSSTDSFERILYEVSHLASLHFSRAGSHRLAVFLGTQCARFHLKHAEYESASRLIRSYVRQCKEDKWWQLMRVNVRLVCQCELELGRAAQAVSACFNLLEIAQKEQDGDEAMGREYWSQVMQALVQRLELHHIKAEDDGTMRLRMGELIRPQLEVETMQSDQTTLLYGQIRVNLTLTNRFPTGIQIGKVRINFRKRRRNKSMARYSFEAPEEQLTDQTSRDEPPADDDETVVCEEENVYLYENASAQLSFLKENLQVGYYECVHVECVLAGFSFALVNEAIQTTCFEILQRKSTLQIAILTPPLLCKGTKEEIHVQIDSVDDFVMGGTLELTLATSNDRPDIGSADSPFGVSFLREGHEVKENISDTCDPATLMEVQATKIILDLPPCVAGCSLLYAIALDVGTETCREVTFSAALRYQRASSKDVINEFRQTQTRVCVDRPMTDSVWVKVLNGRVFVSISLHCNAHVGIVLDRYDLSDLKKKGFQVLQDPNAQLANSRVDPSRNFCMALVLLAPQIVEATVCSIALDFHFIGGYCQAKCDDRRQWFKTLVVALDFTPLVQHTFVLDVTIKSVGSGDDPLSSNNNKTSFAVGEDIVFELCVRRFRCNAQHAAKQASEQDEQTVFLEMDPQSDGDWVVIGKHVERLVMTDGDIATTSTKGNTSTNPFDTDIASGPNPPTSQFSSIESAHCVVSKRLMPSRVGRVAFPRFRLWLADQLITSNLVQLQVGQSVLITSL